MTENDSFFNPPGFQESRRSAPLSHDDFSRHCIQEKYSKEVCYIKEIQKYKKGWDSYESLPPLPESVSLGSGVLSALAKHLETSRAVILSFPEFCLAPDGILGMEWDYASDNNLFARFYAGGRVKCELTNAGEKKAEEMKYEKFMNLCKALQEDLSVPGKARPGHPFFCG